MGGCITCDLFGKFDAQAMGFARDAFELLAPSTALAFNAFVGCWLAYVLVVHGVMKADLDWRDLVLKGAVFTVCGVMLTTANYYWEWIYVPAYEAMNGIAVTLVSKESFTTGQVRDVASMLGVVEREILRVLEVVKKMIQDGGMWNIGPIIGGLFLAVPYLFVWGIFLAFVLEGIFKLLAITAVSPLLIAAAGFRPTRGFTLTGLRVILGGVLTVVFAAVAMGFTVSIMAAQLDKMPVGAAGFKTSAADWMFGPGYWAMFVLGFISILFHQKAATRAATISGANDGPGASATVVGAGMAAAGAAVRFGLGRGRAALGRVAEAPNQARERIWQSARPSTANGVKNG